MRKPTQGMRRFEEDAHSFVIRMWYERDDRGAKTEWRGWIDHVHSGKRHYFRDIDDMSQFILDYMQQPLNPYPARPDGEEQT